MDRVIENKRGLENSDQLLFRLQNKFRNIALVVMHYLTKIDDVM